MKSIEVLESGKEVGGCRRVPVEIGTEVFVGMMTEFGWKSSVDCTTS